MKLFEKGIGIVSIPDRDRAGPVLKMIVSWLSERHFTIFIESNTSQILDSKTRSLFSSCNLKELPGQIDMILVLGGDGTLLRVAHYIERENIPILGVNLGDLGFLTDVKVDEVLPILEEVMNGKYSIDKRMLLQATVSHKEDKIKLSSFALNEIVVNNGPQSRLLHLASFVDDMWINTFLADGLIISTPTGSTAYSLSAGGPIVHPKLHAILITPICPHILTNRPILISDEEKIKVEVKERGIGNGGECLLSADGRALAQLKPGDKVEVKKAQHTIALLQPKGTDYYHVLRTKLKWGERG